MMLTLERIGRRLPLAFLQLTSAFACAAMGLVPTGNPKLSSSYSLQTLPNVAFYVDFRFRRNNHCVLSYW